MNHIEFIFYIKELPGSSREILILELDRLGFEGTIEEEGKIVAYISENNVSAFDMDNIQKEFIYELPSIKYKHKIVNEKNWNELWESNFDPVIIQNKCVIRAPFHKNLPKCKYEIIIEPKMSFGTGHHETTSLMIEEMLHFEFNNKAVLDMGCGTGVLAILASQLKAKEIIAVDHDKWAYQNAMENCIRNKVKNVKVILSDITDVSYLKFDIILSNINKNINLQYLDYYEQALNNKGIILLSGILEEDISQIKQKANDLKLTYVHSYTKKNWVLIKFIKN